MAKVIPVGYTDCSIGITRAGDPDPYMITFGLRNEGPVEAAHLDLIEGQLDSHLRPVMLNVDRFSSIRLQVANDGPPLIYEKSIDLVGVGSQQAAPQNVAIIVSKLTGLGGRWNKGRVFWPSVNEGAVDPVGQVNPAAATAIEDGFNAFADGLVNPLADYRFGEVVILHSEGLQIPPTRVTYWRVEPVVGTQRRRLRR